MALTGLDIYKNLPKENCKECGLPTCLAFAMKVASGQAGLDECPRLTDEARAGLNEASAPPQRLVKIGPESARIELGQETVMFRHDEKFHHPTVVALSVSDADEAAVKTACEQFGQLQFPRVGDVLQADMIALRNDSGSADTFAAAAKTVSDTLGVGLVLISDDIAALKAAVAALPGGAPVAVPAASASADELVELAGAGAVVCVSGEMSAVADGVEALSGKDVKEMMISPGKVDTLASLTFLTQTRRAALMRKFRQLGCPALVFAEGDDHVAASLDACGFVCKYAGIIVTNAWEPELLAPILTARQNIYTDPQKPVQVEPKIYEIGEVTGSSPLLVTTNFSLSYYSVESEVEAARVPCRILAVDTEGTSVLTAWAADKFNPETIADALKASGADGLVDHHKVIIPGHVAVLTAQLAEDSGWEVLVGPKEASGIGPYLKNEWKG